MRERTPSLRVRMSSHVVHSGPAPEINHEKKPPNVTCSRFTLWLYALIVIGWNSVVFGRQNLTPTTLPDQFLARPFFFPYTWRTRRRLRGQNGVNSKHNCHSLPLSARCKCPEFFVCITRTLQIISAVLIESGTLHDPPAICALTQASF